MKKRTDQELTIREPLVEGIDYTVENGNWVFTKEYHLKRGYCCKSECRHCPWGFKKPLK
ncbi:MAG: hypothetical protein KDD61_04120 [Bdellovibrionales bacterium]|nr:hypothetical protein [Bdellovibrionales bacterium]